MYHLVNYGRVQRFQGIFLPPDCATLCVCQISPPNASSPNVHNFLPPARILPIYNIEARKVCRRNARMVRPDPHPITDGPVHRLLSCWQGRHAWDFTFSYPPVLLTDAMYIPSTACRDPTLCSSLLAGPVTHDTPAGVAFTGFSSQSQAAGSYKTLWGVPFAVGRVDLS